MQRKKINYQSLPKEPSVELEETHEVKEHNILCKLCGRSSMNGIRCLGMCVAESEY